MARKNLGASPMMFEGGKKPRQASELGPNAQRLRALENGGIKAAGEVHGIFDPRTW